MTLARKKRGTRKCPASVVIIGLLLAIMGALAILSRDMVGIVTGTLSLAAGLLMLLGERWGWYLGVVLCIAGIAGCAAGLFPASGGVIWLIVSVVVLVLLMLKDARRWFDIRF